MFSRTKPPLPVLAYCATSEGMGMFEKKSQFPIGASIREKSFNKEVVL
jgi:hypothetical protein